MRTHRFTERHITVHDKGKRCNTGTGLLADVRLDYKPVVQTRYAPVVQKH